ncbi:hypothetical protein A2480_01590 [Candidatus Uhrbacteria bacterium RIFOXYC2_FULL_47_19]|uniref:DUF5667 domain-containing protein n=1 Tax=Candidatus Uhrbacteria bacterium RIFOXYC2_FULL_47_19 TaxID=1802424 RepID=A0A1F7WFP6_9BACT|nr:MAG: hypothetical protein A2480_01590 [Candidatus Uhrbacteria bacterium RIFOXYC2_FULL_47_19]
MTQNTTKKLLQTIRDERRGGAPREDWVTRNREILLMQVSNTTDAERRPKTLEQLHHLFGIFMPLETATMAVRTFGIFLLVIGTVLGGGLASAQMYHGAMPGEMLYGVKMAVEHVQLALSPNDEYKFGLDVEFADRRIDEIARLAESSDKHQELLPDVLVSFERNVVALRSGLEKLQADDPDGAVELAKMLERKMTTYQGLLQKAANTLPSERRVAVSATRNSIDDTAIAAMSIIVRSHIDGDERASRSIVVSKFEDRIKQAEHNLDSVIADQDVFEEKSPAIRAKTAIAEAKLLIEKEDYKAALGKIVEVAELTKEAEEAVIQDEEAINEEVDESQDSADQKDAEESEDSAVNSGSDNNDENATSAEPAESADTKSDDAVGSGSR